jgi:hypothetical protein
MVFCILILTAIVTFDVILYVFRKSRSEKVFRYLGIVDASIFLISYIPLLVAPYIVPIQLGNVTVAILLINWLITSRLITRKEKRITALTKT